MAQAKSKVQQTIEFSFKSRQPTSLSKKTIMKLRSHKHNPLLNHGFTVDASYRSTGGITAISLKRTVNTTTDAVQLIHSCRKAWPTLISESQVIAAEAELKEIMNRGTAGSTQLKLQCNIYPTDCWIALELNLYE